MNHYRKKSYYRKRNFNSGNRNNRRYKDTYHQPTQDSSSRIPYAKHTLTKGDVEAVVEAMLSGTLTQGKELERFESLLAKLTHCHYALAVNSGTAAIHTVLAAIDLQPGDEVILSTLNFCAAANMVRLMGGVPVLVDCDSETLTMSVEEAEKAVTENTKAIFANNFAGHASDMVALRAICEKHELVLLEDACHGLGGRYRGHYIGNQADLTCFSFHPSKAITSGEGGAVTTNDIDKYAFMKLFRHHGIQKDADYFQEESFNPDFHQEVQHMGMNYRMNEMQAALGRNQLTRLDRHIERRRAIAQVYHKALSEFECLILPQSADWADHAYHLYPIQLTSGMFGKRDQVFSMFKENGVDVQVHYIPLHLMPLYKEDNSERAFPNAESYYKSCISLPMFPDLAIKDIDLMVDLLKKAIEAHSSPVPSQDKAVEEDERAEQPTEPFVEETDSPAEEASQQQDATEEVEEKPEKKSPYRRRGRRKLASLSKSEPVEKSDSSSDDNTPSDTEKAPIEEPPATEPKAEPSADTQDEQAEKPSSDSEKEATDTPKPKARRRPGRPRKTAASKATAEDNEKTEDGEKTEAKPRRKTSTRKPRKTAQASKTAEDTESASKDEAEEKPKRTPRKRTTTRKAKTTKEKAGEENSTETESKPVKRGRKKVTTKKETPAKEEKSE